MYNFVDTIERPSKSNVMTLQTVFNGTNLDNALTDSDGEFTTLTVTGRSNYKKNIKTNAVLGLDGVIEEQNPKLDPREPQIKFRIRDKTSEGFRKRLTRLISLLGGSKKQLEFTDEDVLYYATVSELDIPEEESNDLICHITLLCSDPYKYGPEETKDIDDNDMIENKGTADADPIFELTAKEKSAFALISLGADEDSKYNLIGTPTEVDEEIVDAERVIFEERGRTLDSWTSTGTAVDGGDVSGELNTDYDGITVPNYGTGKRWHGPALIKEINAIQDFEVEMMLRAETRRSDQTFRIEMYLFDENMNNLGKMGIWDNDYNGNEKKGEARYGPMGAKFERYLISSRNYKQKVNQYFGMLRWTREGDKMTFYITRINTRNEHVKSIKESVRVDESLMGKLKYIQIHIGKYADKPNANSPRLLSIKTTEFLKYTVDQTPNIVYPGDVITFDHKVDDILINGEPRNDLKNFGGSFFTLKKGLNNLIVTPPDTFDAKVTYRDKFL